MDVKILLAIVGALAFFAGIAYADLIVTWKLRRHVSVDGVLILGLCIFTALLTAYFLPAF